MWLILVFLFCKAFVNLYLSKTMKNRNVSDWLMTILVCCLFDNTYFRTLLNGYVENIKCIDWWHWRVFFDNTLFLCIAIGSIEKILHTYCFVEHMSVIFFFKSWTLNFKRVCLDFVNKKVCSDMLVQRG